MPVLGLCGWLKRRLALRTKMIQTWWVIIPDGSINFYKIHVCKILFLSQSTNRSFTLLIGVIHCQIVRTSARVPVMEVSHLSRSLNQISQYIMLILAHYCHKAELFWCPLISLNWIALIWISIMNIDWLPVIFRCSVLIVIIFSCIFLYYNN